MSIATSNSAKFQKRILILNYEYPPLGGGAANATRYLMQEYAKESDWQVDVITSAHDNNERIDSVAENITIYFLPIGEKRNSLHHQSSKDLIIYSWKALWLSRKLIQQKHYTAIHAFFGVPSGFIALLLSYWYSVPYIVSLRGSDVPGYSERFKNLYPLLRPFIRLIWGQAAFVVANSQGLKKLAQETTTKKRIDVIPNGVDTENFKPVPVSLKSEHLTEPFIITTGATRITERKGLIYLLKAVLELQKQYPSIRVEIMGEGSEKKILENFAQENNLKDTIRFLGRIPANETVNYYNRAQVFVLPSFNEGMSNALLEALACGLPAIVTDTGGSQELVTDGINGLYIDMKSSESIKIALQRLLENKALRIQMARASRVRAEELNWGKVSEQYRELYTKAAA